MLLRRVTSLSVSMESCVSAYTTKLCTWYQGYMERCVSVYSTELCTWYQGCMERCVSVYTTELCTWYQGCMERCVSVYTTELCIWYQGCMERCTRSCASTNNTWLPWRRTESSCRPPTTATLPGATLIGVLVWL